MENATAQVTLTEFLLARMAECEAKRRIVEKFVEIEPIAAVSPGPPTGREPGTCGSGSCDGSDPKTWCAAAGRCGETLADNPPALKPEDGSL